MKALKLVCTTLGHEGDDGREIKFRFDRDLTSEDVTAIVRKVSGMDDARVVARHGDLIASLREPRAGIHDDGTEELKTWEALFDQCRAAADALESGVELNGRSPEPPEPEDHEQAPCGWNAAEEGVCYECGLHGSREPGFIPACPREPQPESNHE